MWDLCSWSSLICEEVMHEEHLEATDLLLSGCCTLFSCSNQSSTAHLDHVWTHWRLWVGFFHRQQYEEQVWFQAHRWTPTDLHENGSDSIQPRLKSVAGPSHAHSSQEDKSKKRSRYSKRKGCLHFLLTVFWICWCVFTWNVILNFFRLELL